MSEYRPLICLPVLPLRGIVVFPGIVTHFDVGRLKSAKAVDEAMRADQRIFLTAQKDLSVDDPKKSDLYTVGTIAVIKQILRLPGDNMRILVEGQSRAEMVDCIQSEPYLFARVEEIEVPAYNKAHPKVQALLRQAHGAYEQFVDLAAKNLQDGLLQVISSDDAGFVADFIGQNSSIPYPDKQKLLEQVHPVRRLELAVKLLAKELEILELENEISEKVQQNVNKGQRDYYLREQMHVIREELGEEDDEADSEGYQEKIRALKLPEQTETKLLKEARRLGKQQQNSAEAAVIRNYLDLVLELPWNTRTKERLDVKAAEKILDEDHFGLEPVKKRILETLAVRQLAPELPGQILCLVGPPGVGKTSVAISIAKALNRKLARLSLGGVRDEAEIRGHRKTYIGAMPGRIIEAISRSGSMNPLLVLDEVDKMGSDGRGDPASALLEVLDSEQNYAFRDHYLEIPVDLSRVMFIMTANTLDTIPRPLLDRMEIIEIPSYTDEEKVQIAQRHLLPKERQAHGLTASSLRVDESAIRATIALYTRESGVRSLERQLGKICRKAAMQLATSDVKRVTVTEKNIKDFLGAPRAAQEKIPEKDLVGVVNGLAWTEVGGEILPVEVGVMDGSGKVELTGNLGDVMQESCRAALSCLRQRAQELGIAPDFYKTKDIHIHFPEGAIPKDGPSAGIAIATAVLSALTGQAVHRDVAMTGEITLRGRVLAIGGLREKTMGALRAGVHTVILPKENEKDLDEIDPLVREKLRFVPVETVDAVFAEALVLPEKCTAAAHESYLPPVQESAHGALRAGEMS